MNYFDGIKFLGRGSMNRHTAANDRIFSDYYGIQYNHSGGLHLKVDDREFKVEGAWAFITWPGPHFFYGSIDGQPRSHNFVCFAGERAERFREGGLLPIRPELPIWKITRPELFMGTMGELIKVLNSEVVRYERAVCLLENLLLQFHEQEEPARGLPAYMVDSFHQLLEDIRKSPQSEWEFEREASALNISMTHFRRLFKQYAGVSPQQFLINCRLRLAASLLVSDTGPISQVANLCGFDDEFYFSRMFKKKHHFSPLAYRHEFQSMR